MPPHKVKSVKTIKVAPVAKVAPVKAILERYTEAVGRRKTSVARVRLFAKQSGVVVNGLDYKAYFRLPKHQESVMAPFSALQMPVKTGVTVKVSGGGLTGQAEAVRHGISRALIKLDGSHQKRLREVGYLTRDSRMVERKKYGLKKARRAPQWAKR
ncbi:MAG: 30S ribosomal protein S9 [bacterium]|nr:30S ribosomal protein S9 [bacterium]